MSWQDDKACGQVPVPRGYFYPSQPIDIMRAQQFCWMFCTVREDCLDAAMRAEAGQPYRFGVWGGHNSKERTEMAISDPRWPTVVKPVAVDDLTMIEVAVVFTGLTADVGDPAYACGCDHGDESDRECERCDPVAQSESDLRRARAAHPSSPTRWQPPAQPVRGDR